MEEEEEEEEDDEFEHNQNEQENNYQTESSRSSSQVKEQSSDNSSEKNEDVKANSAKVDQNASYEDEDEEEEEDDDDEETDDTDDGSEQNENEQEVEEKKADKLETSSIDLSQITLEKIKEEHKRIDDVFKRINDDLEELKNSQNERKRDEINFKIPLTKVENLVAEPEEKQKNITLRDKKTSYLDFYTTNSSSSSILNSANQKADIISSNQPTQPVKLKKFNVNFSTNQNAQLDQDKEQEEKRKQELLLKNESEKEKTQKLIRELISSSDTKSENSSGYESISKSSYQVNDRIRKNSVCTLCKKSASITERVSVQGLVYHRDCIRCFVCDSLLRITDAFQRRQTDEQIRFYCGSHNPDKFSLDNLPPIDVDAEEETDSNQKMSEEDENETKWPTLNEKYISKRKKKTSQDSNEVEKSASPSFISSSISNTFSSSISSNSISQHSNDLKAKEEQSAIANSFDFSKSNDSMSKEQKIILDCHLIRKRALEKARLKSDEELGLDVPQNIKKLIMPLKTAQNEPNRPLKIITSSLHSNLDSYLPREAKKFESKTETDSENEGDADAPLAQSETFETLDELNKNEHKLKLNRPGSEQNAQTASNQPANKKTSIRSRITKFLSPNSPSSKSQSKSPSPNPSPNTSALKKLSPTGGILKLFNSKSKSDIKSKDPIDLANFSNALNLNSDSQPEKKKIIPNLVFDSTDSASTSSSKDYSNSNDEVFDSKPPLNGSFNALNVTNSPRLSKNSRMMKLNSKRQQNEERKLEKQRQDKRLRMSQEIQRKLDEIETKLFELEREGVELEKTIVSMDSSDAAQLETKEKLEQELYNLIHEKNLLTRVENELNIQ